MSDFHHCPNCFSEPENVNAIGQDVLLCLACNEWFCEYCAEEGTDPSANACPHCRSEDVSIVGSVAW